MTANNLKESQTLRGIFYPRKITYVLSSLKIAAGCGLVLLGALALYQKASYAKTGWLTYAISRNFCYKKLNVLHKICCLGLLCNFTNFLLQ